MTTAIEARAVSKTLSARRLSFFHSTRPDSDGESVLQSVSLSLMTGEILCVSGDRGCGKSVLLRVLAGRVVPTSGSVRIHGFDLIREARQARRLVSYVSLEGDWTKFRRRTGRAIIARLASTEDQISRASAALRMLELEELMDRSPFTYSMGQRRCFQIACAVLSAPVVVIDDLFCGLDNASAALVQELLRTDTREWNGAVVFSTSRIEEAKDVADRILVLARGTVVDSAPSEEVALWPRRTRFSIKLQGTSVAIGTPVALRKPDTSDALSADMLLEGESRFLAFLKEILTQPEDAKRS